MLWTVTYSLVSLGIVWTISTAVQRLFLSPISKFPGPTLAALTFWYEFYYDVYLPGQYIFKIEELHKTYGEDAFAFGLSR